MDLAESEVAVVQPVKPLRPRASVEQNGDELRIGFRHRKWGAGGFLLLWLCGWTVGCVFLTGMVIANPGVFQFLFAIPFWTSWVAAFLFMLSSVFRCEALVLDRDGLRYASRILVAFAPRRVPLAEIKRCQSYSKVVDNENGRRESGLEIVTLGRPVRCLQGLSDDEIAWLQFTLESHLAGLTGQRGAAHGRAAARQPTPFTVPSAEDADSAETLAPQRNPVDPPSDCSWTREDDFHNICFVRRGRFHFGAVVGLLFVTLFWNGIVSVFVAVLCGLSPDKNPPAGATWWGMFVFLIPFEVIGLGMLVALLAAVVEPAHRTRWTFLDDRIELRHAWFGLGRRWSWLVVSLGEIQLRKEEQARARGWRAGDATDESPGYRLLFVDRRSNEVCSVTDLTEGEARWIGQTIREERSEWFR